MAGMATDLVGLLLIGQVQAVPFGIVFHFNSSMADVDATALNFSLQGFEARGPSLSAVAFVWVLQKVLVISEVLSARLLFAVVPFNLCVLVVGCALTLWTNLSWSSVACDSFYFGIRSTATLAAVMSASAVAASIALLWTGVRKAMASRQLFFFTRKTVVKIDTLLQEADPFNPERLRRWLDGVEKQQQQHVALAVDTAFSTNSDTSDTNNTLHNLSLIHI